MPLFDRKPSAEELADRKASLELQEEIIHETWKQRRDGVDGKDGVGKYAKEASAVAREHGNNSPEFWDAYHKFNDEQKKAGLPELSNDLSRVQSELEAVNRQISERR